MQSPGSPSGSVRRHARNISHPIPQRAARGPLETETETETATHDPLTTSIPHVSSSILPPQDSTPSPTPPPPTSHTQAHVDLRFLQDRKIYHSVTAEDIPSPFLNSTHRPPVEASLTDLLSGGHFRRAAEAAVRAILQSPPTAAERIFPLLYIRLACLVLIQRSDMAAAEALSLVELSSRNMPGAQEIIDLVPWELRLLLVRLQSIRAADGGRRGIMALYALAGEVKSNLRLARKDHDALQIHLWNSRLSEVGLRVCDALAEMGELESAARHLDSLTEANTDEVAYRKVLLQIRLGDVSGACRYAQTLQDHAKREGFEALLQVADGNHQDAVAKWRALMDQYPDHDHFALNAAVSLLYTGQMAAARDLLEDVARNRLISPTLLFNLSTVYELCTERAPEKKTALIQQVAARQPSPAHGGWEHAAFDFKL